MLTLQPGGAVPGPGIPETLARERAAAIRDLRYELAFTVPDDRRAPLTGRVIVRFTLAAPHRVVLDFAQPRDRVRAVRVSGRDVPYTFSNGHITIPAEATRAGANDVDIDFVAGDDSLNRNDEFLYTLFVPARAHRTFPCFDQPNLKGRYTLSLDVPEGWQAVGNGATRETTTNGGRTRLRFAETQPLSTYLFSFATGKFTVETATRNGRQLRMFHRETDAAKVARNRDAIFDLHATALKWLEDYTAIPYPFGKFEFVLIPAFQFSGMEHPGAILYNSPSLMLDESATQNQLLNRASLIAHETSHMWFGDLVTMEWFNDVWTKEVFASFMGSKIVNPSFPQVNHDLRFLLANYPTAYGVDRTAGTNPIRQPLANLDEAGQLYGAIIYQKAPIVMRQLETIVGESAFRAGLREYLKTYSFRNATWLDLIRILDARTPQDLAAWSRAWVEERGRPEFTTELRIGLNGRVDTLALNVVDPLQRNLVWPQRVVLQLAHGDATYSVTVDIKGVRTPVPRAYRGTAPLRYVLPNADGRAYGLFVLDPASRDYLLAELPSLRNVVTRGSAWVTLWENMLEGHVTPGAFLDLAVRALPQETDEQLLQRILAYTTRAYWRHVPASEREARAPKLEAVLRAGLDRAGSQSLKAAWFAAFRDVTLTYDGLAWLERVWSRQEKIPGLTFAETDEITMAMELAVREVPAWKQILQTQLERTQNPDRKQRFAFVMPALSADPAERERAFARFRDVENRRREPWVVESMAYLNHPLREAHARRFVRPALRLLREVQQTGDIFFPTNWLDALLSGHRSPAVAADVRDFLAEELQYPQRLRWKVLSAADELFRIVRR